MISSTTTPPINRSEACFLAEFSSESQYQYYRTTSIATVSLNITSALWVAVGNLSILIAVAKIKQLQMPSTLLLVSLIANDFLVGVVLQPLAISRSLQWVIADKFCIKLPVDVIRMFFIYLCRCNSLLNLLCLSIERYIAISIPHKYKTIVSKKRAVVSVIAVWAYNILLTVVVQFCISEQAKNAMKSIPFGIMGGLILFFQVAVFRAYRRNNQIDSSEAGTMDEINELRFRVKFEKKAAITLLWILTAFLVSYLPIIVIFLIRAANGRNYLRLTTQWLEVVLCLNSAINPIIYFHRYTNLRNEVKTILCSELCARPLYQDHE